MSSQDSSWLEEYIIGRKRSRSNSFANADMPSQRSYGSYSSVPLRYNRRMVVAPYKRRRNYKSRVPRAIATRGTPSGYYEIPVRAFFKLYVNTSTGAWNTDPQSGATSGATGYKGMGISFDYSNVYIDLGAGSTSTTITVPLSGVSSLQSVFDVMKYVDFTCEWYWTNGEGPPGTSINNVGGPELWLCYDPDDATPPPSPGALLEYGSMLRVPTIVGRTYKRRYYPKIRMDAGTTADATGTSTSLATSQSSTYFDCEKPAVRHMGLKGWFNIPEAQSPATVYNLNCMMTFRRRFKVVR